MSESKLWTPPAGVALLRFRKRKKTVTLPNGKRALVTVDDSGEVTQIEVGDRLDAVVRPRTVKLQLRRVD